MCRNLNLKECEDETHTPEMGTWEPSGTLESSEFVCKGQNTSHWGVHYIIGKLSKCRCQFDSRPLKVENRLNLDACRWSETHHWKAFNESYNFALDLVSI